MDDIQSGFNRSFVTPRASRQETVSVDIAPIHSSRLLKANLLEAFAFNRLPLW
jgi:hypothetical protein